jgi:hypothetical protein
VCLPSPNAVTSPAFCASGLIYPLVLAAAATQNESAIKLSRQINYPRRAHAALIQFYLHPAHRLFFTLAGVKALSSAEAPPLAAGAISLAELEFLSPSSTLSLKINARVACKAKLTPV